MLGYHRNHSGVQILPRSSKYLLFLWVVLRQLSSSADPKSHCTDVDQWKHYQSLHKNEMFYCLTPMRFWETMSKKKSENLSIGWTTFLFSLGLNSESHSYFPHRRQHLSQILETYFSGNSATGLLSCISCKHETKGYNWNLRSLDYGHARLGKHQGTVIIGNLSVKC